MIRALAWVGQQGRYCLILGLALGLLAPGLAEVLRPWVGTLVALLLFVTGMRVGARAAFGSLDNVGPTLLRIGFFQTMLPLLVIALLLGLGLMGWPLALAVSLMLAAPSLTGAPNFAIMMGRDPAPGMRLLVLGTALFPITAFPVLWVLNPTGGGVWDAMSLSLGLLAAILAAVGCGFGIRRLLPILAEPPAQKALDGAAALLLAIVVVGLMSAIGPLLRSDPGALALWLLAALLVNLLLVMTTLAISRRAGLGQSIATAIYAGNRNIALFLIVLPDAVAAPLMIFVGCYQIPMYLTPIVLARLSRNTDS
ncbi:hypothetical protein [Primorskyibacter sp. S187A]|uniref:hypothetical protein n=1 Tax=Primorskyibacter sp. S187A TaxID=3415130 RepID=UPI003C7A69DD